MKVWACGKDHGNWIMPEGADVICPCGFRTGEPCVNRSCEGAMHRDEEREADPRIDEAWLCDRCGARKARYVTPAKRAALYAVPRGEMVMR